MKQLTMLEMYKTNLETGKPLFPVSLPFMAGYSANFASYDKLFARNRHFFYYKDIFAEDATPDTDVLEDFQFEVSALLTKNADSLQKVHDASLISYSPLDNYNMEEKGTDTNNSTNTNKQTFGDVNRTNSYGTDIVNTTLGEQEHSNVIGAQENTNSIAKTGTETTVASENIDTNLGAITKTENIGAINNTDNIGAKTDNTTNGVAGYNTPGMTDCDVSTTVNGAQTNTHTETERVNKESTGSIDNMQTTDSTNTLTHNTTDTVTEKLGTHTDVLTDGQRADTQTRQAREDAESVTRGDDIQSQTTSCASEHMFTRRGNIGVTTSQQMLQSEIDLRLNFNFYDIVFDLIIKELCSYSDSGYDIFLTPFYNNMLY